MKSASKEREGSERQLREWKVEGKRRRGTSQTFTWIDAFGGRRSSKKSLA